jgi:hypothetical protein
MIEDPMSVHPSLLQDVGEGRAFYRPVCGNRDLEHLVAHSLLQADVAAMLSYDYSTISLQGA